MLASAASLLSYVQWCPQTLGWSRETLPETSQGGRRQGRKRPKGCVQGGVGWGWAGAGRAQLSLHPLDGKLRARLLGHWGEEELASLGQAWGRGQTG